jgi:outer membrane lipoprotein-sorting protein
MTRLFPFALLCLLSLRAPAETLDAILSRMDQAASQFHSMSADLTVLTHTEILDDNTTETGLIKMQKDKSGTEALLDFTGSKDPRSIGFSNKTVQIYFPKLNLVQVYKVGKKASLLDQYLLLGFGTSGKALTNSYTVTLAGTEPVGKEQTSKLVLVPKEPAMKEQLSKVEVWLPENSGHPVQQKFTYPSGNFRQATYTNFQLNPPVGSLKLSFPKNAKVENPE